MSTLGPLAHAQAPFIGNPAYSHVVVASGARTIYIAGQVSTDEEGRVVGEGDLAAQTTQVMQNLGLALKAAGASYANIVKIVTFVVGYKPELRPIIGQARSAFFEGMTPPASTLVGVSALAAPEWLIEIEAVAVVGRLWRELINRIFSGPCSCGACSHWRSKAGRRPRESAAISGKDR